MSFDDKMLVCSQCGVEFVFSAGEQDFYEKKGFTHAPKRCRKCRDVGKPGPASGRSHSQPRHMEYVGSPAPASRSSPPRARVEESVEATCTSCGAMTRLPFRPDGVRPVFCKTCFQDRKRSSSRS